MKNKFKRQAKLEERSKLIDLCEIIKCEISEALDIRNYQAARIAAGQLYHAATLGLIRKVGGTTNFRGYLKYSAGVA